MSFLIKISENQYENLDLLKQYEFDLIMSVSKMNKVYVDNFELPSFCLGCLGIKYIDHKSKHGFLEIEHISQMLEQGYGKCDSIVAWHIMIFEMNGIKAEPHIIPTNKGGFHVQMKYQDGNMWKILDPSINLDNLIFENCNDCKAEMMNGTFRRRIKNET
jgi:hypothetical protein